MKTTTVQSGVLVILIATSLNVAACSAAAVASPFASPSPTPTLNPNQLAASPRSTASTGSPSVSGVPSVAETHRPTPSPFDPSLEAMLPTVLRGVPLGRFSAPASAYETGGDLCSLLCPGEPSRLAEAAGLEVEDLTVAIALPDQRSGLKAGVIAVRFPGVETSRLVGIRTRAGGHVGSTLDVGAITTPLTIGSRTVTWTRFPPFFLPEQGEYLLGTGDVLFMVYGDPPNPDGTVPDDVALLIAALP